MNNSTIKKIIGIILLFILLVPYPTEYAPEWKVQVVDKKGNVIANIAVEEEYYYINFLTPSVEKRMTDKNGYVVFPARKFTCPLICRIPIAFMNVFLSLGPGRNIWGGATIVEKDTHDFIRYVNGKTLESEMEHILVNQR